MNATPAFGKLVDKVTTGDTKYWLHEDVHPQFGLGRKIIGDNLLVVLNCS